MQLRQYHIVGIRNLVMVFWKPLFFFGFPKWNHMSSIFVLKVPTPSLLILFLGSSLTPLTKGIVINSSKFSSLPQAHQFKKLVRDMKISPWLILPSIALGALWMWYRLVTTLSGDIQFQHNLIFGINRSWADIVDSGKQELCIFITNVIPSSWCSYLSTGACNDNQHTFPHLIVPYTWHNCNRRPTPHHIRRAPGSPRE